MDENIKLECLKLAFSAAIQYGAFKPENLGVRGHSVDGKPNHNLSTHFGAVLGMADALYQHVSKEEQKQVCSMAHFNPEELHVLDQLQGSQEDIFVDRKKI